MITDVGEAEIKLLKAAMHDRAQANQHASTKVALDANAKDVIHALSAAAVIADDLDYNRVDGHEGPGLRHDRWGILGDLCKDNC